MGGGERHSCHIWLVEGKMKFELVMQEMSTEDHAAQVHVSSSSIV